MTKNTHPLSAAGGNYYANSSEARGAKRFGRQVARQRRTLRDAMIALEDAVATGPADRGYVQLWVAAENQRHIVAELDEAGNWWARSRYDGTLTALASPREQVPA